MKLYLAIYPRSLLIESCQISLRSVLTQIEKSEQLPKIVVLVAMMVKNRVNKTDANLMLACLTASQDFPLHMDQSPEIVFLDIRNCTAIAVD